MEIWFRDSGLEGLGTSVCLRRTRNLDVHAQAWRQEPTRSGQLYSEVQGSNNPIVTDTYTILGEALQLGY